ncbi:HD domain-containing protein [Candidatus Micrarchaeota archaeon]|nr:HD domain-containing protein [Candidatus Micrarchaeota archaeon]
MQKKIAQSQVDFLFEIGDLKRIKRSGWWHCKISNPESVAEHLFRSSVIAFMIAKMDGQKEPEKIAFACLLHDLPESRLLDLHKISSSYVKNKHGIEKQIFDEQEKIAGVEFPKINGIEIQIIKDADLLEMAFTAKEYMESGFSQAKLLFEEAGKKLTLKSSREIYGEMESRSSQIWWRELSLKK